jgi:hypothetical protein
MTGAVAGRGRREAVLCAGLHQGSWNSGSGIVKGSSLLLKCLCKCDGRALAVWVWVGVSRAMLHF